MSEKNHAFSSKEGSPSYILKTGRDAAQALEEQHKILEKDSHQHVQKAGLKSGQVVWEIGCGTGTMTEHFCKNRRRNRSCFCNGYQRCST